MAKDKKWELTLDDIIDYESGDMDWDRIVNFFQNLIDYGYAWSLQGHYGRTAMNMVEEGYCNLPPDSPYAKRLEE